MTNDPGTNSGPDEWIEVRQYSTVIPRVTRWEWRVRRKVYGREFPGPCGRAWSEDRALRAARESIAWSRAFL